MTKRPTEGGRVLLVAFHFPPAKTSSGIQRTLKFARYLPDYGWTPAVLSIAERAHPATMDDQMKDVPESLPVKRVFGLDTARHLAVNGRYLDWMAYPDRWVSWAIGGLLPALAFLRSFRPEVIVSTYPIASAHLLAYGLHRLTGIPWVADCRDSMTEEGYPREPGRRRCFLWIERRMVAHAARVIFTTEGTRRMYAARYPEVPQARWAVIENGYDEENFRHAAEHVAVPAARDRVTIVHSGIVYPSERDPTALFQALATLKQKGFFAEYPVRLVLRATAHDHLYAPQIEALGITDIVELAEPMGYEAALGEQLRADGLLLLQGANCNHQIPAKAYEYIRARRPVLALTDAAGDTAGVLRRAGLDAIAPLDDAEAIAGLLERFVKEVTGGTAKIPVDAAVEKCSRRLRTRELALLLDAVMEQRRAGFE